VSRSPKGIAMPDVDRMNAGSTPARVFTQTLEVHMNNRLRVRLRKLNTLANFIEDLPSDKFFMPHWGSTKDATKITCGTAGCAAGWAVTLFHRRGLQMVFSTNEGAGTPCPTYRGFLGSQAFATYFGIKFDEAEWIVSSLEAPTYMLLSCGSGRSTDYATGDADDQLYQDEILPSYVDEHDLDSTSEITSRMAARRIRQVLRVYDPSLLDEQIAVIPDWAKYHNKPQPELQPVISLR